MTNMGKLLCDSTTIAKTFQTSSPIVSRRDPQSPDLEAVDLVDQTEPGDHSSAVVFRLSHGGEVSPDGNCLFTASQRTMACEIDVRELRRRAVKRFVEDLGSAIEDERESINKVIRHMYSPDLRSGWRVQVVQEVKLLAKKEDRVALDSAIDELIQLGMQR
ncbi:hypothetical protein SLEP1_g1356 [Rubroshorea leprosula]|uniref:OTU domain-containing protein n=1 Tax=Rubroshorea leprosula TaxID=152421 RepID=A0AAV5HLU8_9ROSI|nr:hypothetical protein SLEP1_g1356 [Rubroshorea leprosula]